MSDINPKYLYTTPWTDFAIEKEKEESPKQLLSDGRIPVTAPLRLSYTATQPEHAVNLQQVNNLINQKFINEVDLSNYVTMPIFNTQMSNKVNQDYVDIQLSYKLNITTFNTAIATKADVTALALKADKTYVDDGLALKADKTYVDNAISSSGFSVGDIIISSKQNAPANFLNCDGSSLSKTTYSSLYDAIGDNYTMKSIKGEGRPWERQYNLTYDIDVAMESVNVYRYIPTALAAMGCAVTNKYIYIFGGVTTGTTAVNTVCRASITDSSSNYSTFTTTTPLPTTLAYFSHVVYNGYIYIIGGLTGGTTYTNAIYYAAINADGTLGEWQTSAVSLPVALGETEAIIINNVLYVIGGTTDGTTRVNTVYKTTFNSNGTLNEFTTNPNLPFTISRGKLVYTEHYLYYIGGIKTTIAVTSCLYCPVAADGSLGSWSSIDLLPSPLCGPNLFYTNNAVYIYGSQTATIYSTSNAFKANINPDGTISSFSRYNLTNCRVGLAGVVIIKNNVHVIGGFDATTARSSIFTITINGGYNDYSSIIFSTGANVTNNFNIPNFNNNQEIKAMLGLSKMYIKYTN